MPLVSMYMLYIALVCYAPGFKNRTVFSCSFPLCLTTTNKIYGPYKRLGRSPRAVYLQGGYYPALPRIATFFYSPILPEPP